MNYLIVLIFTSALSLSAAAQDFRKGVEAYDRGDYVSALREWRPLAERGVAQAQSNLGFMYEHGQGVTQDYGEAAHWYRKAAEQGDAVAQGALGVMYDNGRGVPQDHAEAVKWYRKSAEQNNAKAQSNLGVLYGNGLGVPQDNVLAYLWFSLSAEQGNKVAIENRDFIGEQMTASEIAKAQRLARDWLEKHGKQR